MYQNCNNNKVGSTKEENTMKTKMETKSLLALTCCLVVCVNCAKKSRVEKKVDVLDNLFRGEMYLVNEKLETGKQEREMLLEKFNETMEYLEKLDKVEGKTLADTNTEGRQSDLDMLLDKTEILSDKVEQNNRVTEELSETLIRMKRGVQEEKVARKFDANTVIEQLLEMQKNQTVMQEIQNKMQIKQNEMVMNINTVISMLDNLITVQGDLMNKVNDIASLNLSETLETTYKHGAEVLKSNDIMQTQLTEVVSNTQNLESNINTMAQQIREVKEDVAPTLYCENKLNLDGCLEKHFTQQQQLLDSIRLEHLPIILAGGESPYEGRVEINYKGRKGTVCNDYWDNNDAQVVCKMLRFPGGTALQSHSFGTGRGDILLDDVACTGSEESLFDCKHAGLGVNDCSHAEDAGVRCDELNSYDTDNYDVMYEFIFD